MKEKSKGAFWTLKKTGYIFTAVVVALPLLDFIVFYCIVNGGSIFAAFIDRVEGGFTLDHIKAVIASFGDRGSGDSLFVCLKNTMIYFGASFVTIPASIILTYFLYQKIFGHNVFRLVFFLPILPPTKNKLNNCFLKIFFES